MRHLLLSCVLIAGAAAAAVPAAPVVQAAADSGADAAFFESCGALGPDWIRYKDSCYSYYEADQYWYLAEQECRSRGGHLVSINDKAENTFVAKLTYCQSAWTGGYAVNADRLREPGNYRWTDGTVSVGGYHAHNFTVPPAIHHPLLSVANLHWRNRVYHARDKFVCEVKGGRGSSDSRCPAGWRHLDGNCYLMPDFETTWIEASFYCNGRAADLVSLYNTTELRAISLLDVGAEGCPPETWIGLIKVNPCIIDMFSAKPICYMWSDRLHKLYSGFPAWHPGHPDTGPRVNCVLLQDRAMKTVECHERRRFVCKKPARLP